jgi:DNA-binding response OmpR family regulator
MDDMERFWRWLSAKRERAAVPVILLAPHSAKLVPASLPHFFQPERDGLVPKPLEGEKLASEVARVLAARPVRTRRAELLRVGCVTLVPQQLLLDSGDALSLTPTEFRLLRYLMQRPGEFISPDELLEHVWGYPPGTAGPEVVRSHVSNLRRKLRGLDGEPQLLRTVPYQGYSFVGSDGAASIS